MLDFDALIASASLPEDTVPICLDGRLVRRYEEVRDRVESRTTQPQPTAGDVRLNTKTKPGVDPEQADLDRLTAEVQSKNVPFVVRAMPRDDFVAFMASPEFDARKDDAGEVIPRDARLKLNTDVFVPALVKASLVDPDVSVPGRWEQLRKVLTHMQMVKLFNVAWSVNSEDRDIPFSPAGSPSPANSETA